MVTREYVPEAGDLEWLDFTPQAGREQAGRRPGLILSPRAYNEKPNLVIVCLVTSHAKGYPFEVPMPASLGISGVILSDHLKSLPWRERQAQRAGKVSRSVLQEVLVRIATLLGIC